MKAVLVAVFSSHPFFDVFSEDEFLRAIFSGPRHPENFFMAPVVFNNSSFSTISNFEDGHGTFLIKDGEIFMSNAGRQLIFKKRYLDPKDENIFPYEVIYNLTEVSHGKFSGEYKVDSRDDKSEGFALCMLLYPM